MKSRIIWIMYLLPFLFVAGAWIGYPHFLPHFYVDSLDANAERFGTFGDSFGGLNTLFSGLAFAGIVVSLILQSHGLSQTKSDLDRQRIQQQIQVFESSFFQMLHLSNEIVRGFRYKSEFGGAHIKEGKDCFETMRNDLVKVALLSEHWGRTPSERYEKFYLKYFHDDLGHYFRNLYQIVKYVDGATIENKKFYTNIVRAQLSSNELFLLFYNGVSRFGREKFLPLLRKYELLEHLPDTEDVLQTEAEHYGRSAFGQSPEWQERFHRRSPYKT